MHRGTHFTVEHHSASGYVRLVRTAEPFTVSQFVAEALEHCAKALADLDVSQLGILLDWRLGPFSADPRMHAVIVQHTDKIASRFRRRAILVSTPVGQMQMGRILRTTSTTAPIQFNDEQEAIDYLLASDPA